MYSSRVLEVWDETVICVLLCVVTAVHNFDNHGKKLTNCKKYLTGSTYFPPTVATVQALYTRRAGHLHYLEEGAVSFMFAVMPCICAATLQIHIYDNHVYQLPSPDKETCPSRPSSPNCIFLPVLMGSHMILRNPYCVSMLRINSK